MMTSKGSGRSGRDGSDGVGDRMAVREIITCDVPGCGKEGRTYVITADTVSVRVDLCDDHAGTVPVREAIDLGRGAATSPRGRSAPRVRTDVTLDELPNLDDEEADVSADEDDTPEGPPKRPPRRRK